MEPNELTKRASDFIAGRRVCVAGSLAAMTRAEFRELVTACGGRFAERPPRHGATLVVGADRPNRQESRQIKRARELRRHGCPIEFLTETEFFQSLGLLDPPSPWRLRLTLEELSRVVGTSAATIRRLMRHGLVEPTWTLRHFHYFDFAQAASAKTVLEMRRQGASLTSLARALRWARDRLSHRATRRIQPSDFQPCGRIVLRVGETLIEPNGQLWFDFAALEADTVTIPLLAPQEPFKQEGASLVDSWVEAALTFEENGCLEDAQVLYRRAIAHAPTDPTLRFNLGNVLFALGRDEQAAESYRRAVELDVSYAEAWNNLGVALLRLGLRHQAIRAFRRAVSLAPDYADAQDNLELALTSRLIGPPLIGTNEG